jgi:SUMO ligase MMS21 Smc5/6 complex component
MVKRKSPEAVLPFSLPKQGVEDQIETWIRGVLRSNDDLVNALVRLRDSYRTTSVGESVNDKDEILAQVQAALEGAAKAKTIV